MKAERDIVVTNSHGLHARPAMQLVDLANDFQSNLTIIRPPQNGEGETVADAKSVMAVITLAATTGTRLHVVAEGEDAEAAADAIVELFESNFGEEE